MQYDNITTDQQLRDFCDQIRGAESIVFDTEFVSEDSYRPHLCLVQVAVGQRLAVIDTLAVEDLRPFWELLAAPGHETVVHAGREEFRFCLEAIGQRPHQWFDVQIAAGLAGMEYPAAYSTLISRLLGKTLPKGETRTNWRARPLSERQLDYALQDVVHLQAIRDILYDRLVQLGRESWLRAELASWQDQLEASQASERWRRLAGISGLSPRALAVVRELWRWREAEAQRRNCPVKRVLRDDLIIELARRQTADLQRIRAVRGLERRDIQRHLPQLARAIEHALGLPEEECPQRPRRQSRPQLTLLGQFLSTALGSICRSAQVAPSLVGTSQDVQDLIAYHLGLDDQQQPQQPPLLARGWRAQVVGQIIDELLDGKLAIRITDPLSDHPLAFEGQPADP